MNFKPAVAKQRSGQHVRLGEDLEPVADADDRTAGVGEALHLGHHRAEASNRTGADVVAVGEAARKHDRVEPREVGVAVPHVARLVAQQLGGVDHVLLAVAAGEDNDTEAHPAHASSMVSMR